jgi:hypothetical protein
VARLDDEAHHPSAARIDGTDETREDQQRTVRLRASFYERYPSLLSEMLESWARPSVGCRVSLMHAANYLFATRGVRWAVDPLLPDSILPDFPERPQPVRLDGLSFVLLTHAHSDHLDHALLADLRDRAVRFVIPEHMREEVIESAGLRDGQVIIARPAQRLELHGIGILPFAGLHWRDDPDARRGTDATGYLVEVGGRRWLFPGDVRDYDAGAVARFAPVDTLYAHLWLGRGRALEPEPPELDAFCEFMRATEPGRVVLTHLYE